MDIAAQEVVAFHEGTDVGRVVKGQLRDQGGQDRTERRGACTISIIVWLFINSTLNFSNVDKNMNDC